MISNFEKYINDYFNKFEDNQIIQAMKYAMDGGKRFRARIIFEIVKGYGLDEEIAYPCALALEMIQCYSLIHDDLPAMDNDDFRRGKPSLHKAFREDIAILAGDALLTHSFKVIADSEYKSEIKIKMISCLANYAGMNGMIYGQLLDVTSSFSKDIDGLINLDANKTGGLFKIASLFAMYLSEIDDEESFINLGYKIGILFQFQDDLFDVIKTKEEFGKSTSDKDNDKFTALSIFSVEELISLINQMFEDLKVYASKLNFDATYLIALLDILHNR